jgi:hypothetical protein
VPWCEECAKFWNPGSLSSDGTCPTCGRDVDTPAPTDPTAGMGPDDVDTSIPWHFWVMLVALAIYLGWRVIQGIAWLLG